MALADLVCAWTEAKPVKMLQRWGLLDADAGATRELDDNELLEWIGAHSHGGSGKNKIRRDR